METAFTLLLGIEHPVQQAVMGGVSGPELAGAVTRAGALGMLCEFDDEAASERMTRALRLGSGGAIGMGFFGQWIDRDLETFEMASDRLRVVEVFWSAPDAALVARARRSGTALVGWQVGSLDEALAAVDAGCDFVVAQGREAGGHVRGTLPRQEQLEFVLPRVSVPVVSAGGITTAADVRTAMAEGAAAVRVGTRFVATEESTAHADYIGALLDAPSGDSTVLTTAFGVGWPDAPHRVLASALVAAEQLDGEVVGHVNGPGGPSPIPRFSVFTPSINAAGHIDAMALYAGTGVGDVNAVLPAAEVVADLVSQLG
jgi:NAD(P)H-dependent flavin oxidoreductase YrpB (nitropropane dioxygenase family)